MNKASGDGARGAIERDSAQAWSVLAILTAAYALAYIDRQLLNLLVDPVKSSLVLTDVQVSLLQGFAFAGAYLCFVPVMGRLVDAGNRRNILFIGCCLWCLFTVACGYADSYWELFAARVGVGASEACVLPASWSLISDYFSSRKMPRAYSVFSLGPLIGGGLALIAGGAIVASADSLRQYLPLLDALESWQIAFILTGVSGLLIALLLLTFREPPRIAGPSGEQDAKPYSLGEAACFLWQRKAFYGRFIVGLGFVSVILLGLPAWLPTFMIRFHQVDQAVAGFQLGVILLVSGSAGILAGPWLARRLEEKGYEGGLVFVAAASMAVTAVCTAMLPAMPTPRSALIVAGAAIMAYSIPTSLIVAALQVGTPNRIRGTMAAMTTLVAQIMGLGMAPTAIAFVTDYIFGDPAMVGWSMGIVCATASTVAAWLLITVAPHYIKARNSGSDAEA